MASFAEAPQPLNSASLGGLFYEFLKVSLFGFGGGIVLAHRGAVERRRWLTESEFADAVTLCQFLPGPNVVGIAICTGAKTRGLSGALAAFAGFALVPGALGFALALIYLGQTRIPVVQSILAGISPAAAGLMIGTGLRLLKPHRRHAPTILIAALAFAGLAIAKLPLLSVLVTVAPLSVAIAVFRARR
jgi:chromate transporter